MNDKIPQFSLINNTNCRWLESVNIRNYAIRQAQSCTYLEILFNVILGRVQNPSKLSELFQYLINVHRRQYEDICHRGFVPDDDNRESFYFNSMYESFGLSPNKLPEIITDSELMNILAIQAVSYLRGHDRYQLLKTHRTDKNFYYIKVWEKFYVDARLNAMTTFNYLFDNFDTKVVESLIKKVLINEDKTMQKIWRKK